MFTCIYSILWFDRLFLIIGICCSFFFHLIADWINQMSCFGSDAIYKVTSNLSRGVKSLTFLLQYTSKRQVHQNIHKYNTWVNELNYIPSLSTDAISFIFLSKVLNCTKSAHTFSGIKSCRCNFAGCLCRITLCVHVFVCVCMRLTGHYPVSQRTQEAIIPGSLDTKCLISLKKRMSCSSSHILQMDTEDALKTWESVRDAAFQLAAIVFL